MAYKIQYSPENQARYPITNRHKRWNWSRFVIPAIILAAMLWVRFNGVPDIMIPGNPEVTRSAASELLVNLSDGVAVKDAVTVFCKEIIDGAQI